MDSDQIVRSFLSGGRSRSSENTKAFALLYDSQLYLICTGLIRQELDTLLRLSYLWHEKTPPEIAISLMKKTVQGGKKWSYQNEKGKNVILRDKDLVEFAHPLYSWEKVVYDFGCKAIHLSDLHMYQNCDPLVSIDQETKKLIIQYLKEYHFYNKTDVSISDIFSHLPLVMSKISSNVEFYFEELENRYLARNK